MFYQEPPILVLKYVIMFGFQHSIIETGSKIGLRQYRFNF